MVETKSLKTMEGSEAETRQAKKRTKKKEKRSKKRPKDVPTEPADESRKKQKLSQPLKGVVLSVSTLKGKTGDNGDGDTENDSSEGMGYNSVCQQCRDLGAQVSSQVCKKVNLLVCTKPAVQKATQRVRKAVKRKIRVVDVAWLDEVKKAGTKIAFDSFLLDDEAKAAIELRASNQDTDNAETQDVPDDAGWTASVSYGCSCVCHENGSEKDCPWCKDGCPATQ